LVLTIRVVPRASKPGLVVEADGSLKVRLKSPPVEGAANAELLEVLADAFGVARRALTIAGGAQSRTKRVRIEGLDEQDVAAVMARLRSRAV
jgi:uncharacterized protein (TIGR00251 family)